MLREVERTESILKILGEKYADAKCSLNYKNPLELLIATILSAQCTDERVNKVTEGLFKKYKSLNDFVRANIHELEKEVYSTGFYKNKAKNIIGSCEKIFKDYKGEVPKSMEKLLKLPGVARKTANVVLGNAYAIASGVVVDTHIGRLSRRFHWTKEKQAEKVEKDLIKIIPKENWIGITHQMIQHGRQLCSARKPKCTHCFLEKICPSFGKL